MSFFHDIYRNYKLIIMIMKEIAAYIRNLQMPSRDSYDLTDT